jgi:hypothetical protein
LRTKLHERRLGLAEATEEFIRLNRNRENFWQAVQSMYPAPTQDESVALCLIYQDELGRSREGLPPEAGELRRQYAERFGHPPQFPLHKAWSLK